jgi:hypothetical protein
MVSVEYSNKYFPLTWYLFGNHVVFTCPNGHFGVLDHKVDDDGEVFPKVVCMHPDCNWQDWIKLEGWIDNGQITP